MKEWTLNKNGNWYTLQTSVKVGWGHVDIVLDGMNQDELFDEAEKIAKKLKELE